MVTDAATQSAEGDNLEIWTPLDATLVVTDTKRYVSVATLSTLDNTK